MRIQSPKAFLLAPLCSALAVVGVWSLMAFPAFAQIGGGGGGGGGIGGGGGGGIGGGGATGSGVVVDADGVVRFQSAADPTGQLARQRVAEAMSRLEGDLRQASELRKVSLTRLERAIAEKIAAGSGPDDAMKNLAGLTRIDYVFCYPAADGASEGEIVLAGPAEPWAVAPEGRTLGIESGAPVVELQDLVTALRAFAPEKRGKSPLIYCSIDPTEEGLSRMQQFLVQFGRQATPGDTQFIVEQLRERLGLQVVTVGGVPAESHFAQVIVEADYRMKLIGIGLEQPPVRLRSYVDRAAPAMVSRNAMQRWFFVPDYDRLKVSQDGLAMEIVGEGVRLVGEDEMVSMDGKRKQVGATNRASQAFVTEFTKNYTKLAERSPVYGQLRNCIDLAVTAAFLQQNDLYSQVGWDLGVLASEDSYRVNTYNPPKQVATAVNSMWKGSTLMTPIGGGVQIDAAQSLKSVNLRTDDDNSLGSKRSDLSPAATGDRWWWD